MSRGRKPKRVVTVSRDDKLQQPLHCLPPAEGARKYEPERHLWAAVIRQAFVDLQLPAFKKNGDLHPQNHPIVQSVKHWFDSSEVYPGSMEWICHHLGISSRMVREKLASL